MLIDARNQLGIPYHPMLPPQQPKPTPAAHGPGFSDEQQNKNDAAYSAYLQAKADNELAILKLKDQLAAAENQRAYQAGLMSLDDYFAKRAQIINTEADAEEAILAQKMQTAQKPLPKNATEADRYKQLQDIGKIQEQINATEIQRQIQIAANDQEEAAAKHTMTLQQLADEKQLKTMQGDTFGAAETALDEEILKYDDLLKKKGGLSDDQRAAAENDYRDAGEAKINYGKSQQDGNDLLTDMTNGIQYIQDQASAGAITQLDAEEQILAVQNKQLPELQKIGQQMLANALLSNDPTALQNAKQFLDKLEGIKTSTKDLTTAQSYLFNQLETQGVSAVENFFTEWLDGSKSFKDSLKDLADAFEQMIAQMIAKMLVLYAMEMLVGWITHGNQDDIDAVGKLFGLGSHAAGGFTANVPANQVAGIVHGQEWVATADQTQRYRPLFAAISAGKPLPFLAQPSTAVSMSSAEDQAESARGSTTMPGIAMSGAAMPGPAPLVQVINKTGQPTQQKQSTGQGGQSITQIIIGAVQQDIASGGKVAQQIQGQYGLSRSGTRRG
jgi:hypothetical protein